MNQTSTELNFQGRQFIFDSSKYPNGCRCIVRKDGDVYLLKRSGNYTVHAINEADANTLCFKNELYGIRYTIKEVNSY